MGRFASDTTVSSQESRAEIERILDRYGADEFAYSVNSERAMIGFRCNNRLVRFDVPMPNRESREFTHTPTTDKPRTSQSAREAYEQATRQRWRALALVVKAKLEAIDSEISTFEQEFGMFFVMPGSGGRRLGDILHAQIEHAYASGETPQLLLGGPAP